MKYAVALLALCAGCATHQEGQQVAPSIQIVERINISSKIAAVGGLPKSVRISSVSGGAEVVVGRYRASTPPHDWHVFRYSKSSGVEKLPLMDKFKADNLFVPVDGKVVWATSSIGNQERQILRYPASGELENLGTLQRKWLLVQGVSAEQVLVGSFLHSYTPENRPLYRAFQYSASRGFSDLGSMTGDSAFARGVSSNGIWVVGNFQRNSDSHAFRYSATEGLRDIGVIGGTAAFASGITNDGSLVVGTFFGARDFARNGYHSHAFVHIAPGQTRQLGALGGRSVECIGISADGTSIFGGLIDLEGDAIVFVARL